MTFLLLQIGGKQDTISAIYSDPNVSFFTRQLISKWSKLWRAGSCIFVQIRCSEPRVLTWKSSQLCVADWPLIGQYGSRDRSDWSLTLGLLERLATRGPSKIQTRGGTQFISAGTSWTLSTQNAHCAFAQTRKCSRNMRLILSSESDWPKDRIKIKF